MMKDRLKKYWCVLVDNKISKTGDILLLADKVAITAAGDLVFFAEMGDKEDDCPIFSLSKGNWLGFYASSTMDGAPCCVEHWQRQENI